jgi:Uma2 family endonuclease
MAIAELPLDSPVETWDDDEALYEVIDGLRVELPMSTENELLSNELHLELGIYARSKRNGWALHETLFELPLEGRQRRRRPDIAFLSFDRWAADRQPPTGVNALPVAPDVAVEFISPSEFGFEILDKLFEYFEAGVRQVWLVYPRHRLVQVYDSIEQTKGFREPHELDGGEVLPGFRIKVSTLFPTQG